MNRCRIGALKVPGATLHYEVRGAGPVLLLIPGGPADAGGFGPIGDVLADRYAVVTYDPRGLSRSPLDGVAGEVTVRTFADDARRLLAEVGVEPAYVLGSSGGALVGIELLTRYPQWVRALVVHEPPLTSLLDDAGEHAAFAREVHDTYRSEGVGPAMGKFLASAGLDGPPPEPAGGQTPEMAEAMARMQRNLDFFLGHMWLPLGDYDPDVSALRSLPVTVAVGEASEGQLAHRTSLALADRLGAEPVVFPGDHGGFGSHPEAFADRLHGVLGSH